MKFSELKDMSPENLEVQLAESKKALFHLRLQARMERLDSPSELRKNKKMIARIKTLQNQRQQKDTPKLVEPSQGKTR